MIIYLMTKLMIHNLKERMYPIIILIINLLFLLILYKLYEKSLHINKKLLRGEGLRIPLKS